MIQIDRRRLLADMRKLAEFGKIGSGVDRPAFSAADMEARVEEPVTGISKRRS